jgi:hypothetical protein
VFLRECCGCDFAIRKSDKEGSYNKKLGAGWDGCDADAQCFESINNMRFSFAASEEKLSAGMKSITKGFEHTHHQVIQGSKAEAMCTAR